MNEEVELSEHSPEQLVALIQQGHSMHFEELFYRFLPLVKKFNRAYYLKSLEQDDFWQEARWYCTRLFSLMFPRKACSLRVFIN